MRITSATWGLDLTAFHAPGTVGATRRMVKVLLYGYGGVFVAKEEVGGGRGVSGAWGGKLPPHVVRVSSLLPGGYMLLVVEPVKDEERFQRQTHHLTENTLGGQGQSRY